MTDAERAELASIAAQLKIGAFHRHVFLCLGPTCCATAAGDAVAFSAEFSSDESSVSPCGSDPSHVDGFGVRHDTEGSS